MIHLGAHAFDTIGGEIVNTVCFSFRNSSMGTYKGKYYRLIEYTAAEKEENFLKHEKEFIFPQHRFAEFPNQRIDYWANEKIIRAFREKPIAQIINCKSGIMAGSERYVLHWYEPSLDRIKFDCNNAEEMGEYHWFPLNSGGEYRKWYGNYTKIIDLWHGGYNIRTNVKNFRLRDPDYYFKDGVTWGRITTSEIAFRDVKSGTLFGDAGPIGFISNNKEYALGFLNSKIVVTLLSFLNPTTNFQVHDIMELPLIISDQYKESVEKTVSENIEIARQDWDAYETSWDFCFHPLCQQSYNDEFDQGKKKYISESFCLWEKKCTERSSTLKSNEEWLNSVFIKLYGLENEMTPEIENNSSAIRCADKQRDIRSLISYFIGIIMGRYSLDVPGLAYAGGDWDASKYVSYQPDDDGIVPIYTTIGMEDGLTTKIIELIKLIYGKDAYRQNIDFIADALGKNSHESSEETLNRYLNDGFYKDHLKTYQKRPIYWLFSSGRKDGFKCLIYMHRYNADTLARINGKYFLPESTRKKNELEEMNGEIARAEGRERLQLERKRQDLAAAYNEAIEYGQVLDHMANQYISIDLDDGVKVNYAKFQGIEIVTDGGAKVKKDLLAAI